VKNTIRNTLLITAAATALVAGAGLASAQGVNDHHEAPAAAAHDQSAPEGKSDQQPGSTRQKSAAPAAQVPEKGKSAPTAQVPEKGKSAPTAQAPEKGKSAPTAQVPEKGKSAPIAQAPEKPVDSKPQTTTGQGGAMQPSQSSKQGATPAPAALSTEQHVKIRETLRGEKVEHLNNVQFSITVGEAIPRTVHLYRFPVSIMEYAPQYRDYEYVLVGDEILVVDPRTLRIVAVISA
jgi:Protein of unknown function (DUF1236)